MNKSYFFILALLLFSPAAIAQVDYGSQIQPIFTNNCNSCHSAGQNSFNSSSYSAVMNSVSPANRYDGPHVVPGDADGSPLVDKIEPDPQFGSRMPVGGALSDQQINLIRQWINEGASETATNNEEEITHSVEEFELNGNYPNPFNPSTTIRFDTPVSAEYQLSVFTVNGQLVFEQSGTARSGVNNVQVDFGNRPSGMYIYRIKAVLNGRELFSDAGLMTLVK